MQGNHLRPESFRKEEDVGTDIHPVLQVKKDGEWKTVDLGMEPQGRWKNTIYDGRNYVLFSILAGVRDAWDIVPIAEPKDLPDDFHFEGQAFEVVGDHSYSWLTLQEIMDYNWDQILDADNELLSYRSLCSDFCEQAIPKMIALADGDWETVRIVFGFDS